MCTGIVGLVTVRNGSADDTYTYYVAYMCIYTYAIDYNDLLRYVKKTMLAP
jgi:hypothetical protein